MATLLELSDLYQDSNLIKKVGAALVIKAGDILANVGTATANEKVWAARIFRDPHGYAHHVVKAILAANSDATVAQITNASDAAVQNNVNAAAALFIDADAGV